MPISFKTTDEERKTLRSLKWLPNTIEQDLPILEVIMIKAIQRAK